MNQHVGSQQTIQRDEREARMRALYLLFHQLVCEVGDCAKLTNDDVDSRQPPVSVAVTDHKGIQGTTDREAERYTNQLTLIYFSCKV